MTALRLAQSQGNSVPAASSVPVRDPNMPRMNKSFYPPTPQTNRSYINDQVHSSPEMNSNYQNAQKREMNHHYRGSNALSIQVRSFLIF